MRRTLRLCSVVVLLLASLGPLEGTALAPFIDLSEPGLTMVQDGQGLAAGFPGGGASLDVNVGGTVRFALLYWAGTHNPCTDVNPSDGVCEVPSQPFLDQQVVFEGTPVTGTIIGSETEGLSGGVEALHIGYFADVTSLVSAAGTGAQSFSFEDGNGASNLTTLQGVELIVAFTNASDLVVRHVLVWDNLDFAWDDAFLAGDNRGMAPVSFNHGAQTNARLATLSTIVGGGESAKTDRLEISNNAAIVDPYDGTRGANWDDDQHQVVLPGGAASTTAQVVSTGEAAPDELLWEAAWLRTHVIDAEGPSCEVMTTVGPPAQGTTTVQAPSGLTSLVVTLSQNADTVVPPFSVGTTDPVVVTSTRIDQSSIALISMTVVAAEGEAANQCDLVLGVVITPTPTLTPTATSTPTVTSTATPVFAPAIPTLSQTGGTIFVLLLASGALAILWRLRAR